MTCEAATASLDARRRVEEPTALAQVAPPPLLLDAPAELAECFAEHLTPRQRNSCLRAAQALLREGVFFLGDGPGTGKTRILAAVALYYAHAAPGVRRLWLVPNALLRKQALRELALLGGTAEILSYAQLRRDTVVGAGACLLLLDEAHALRHPSAQTRAVDALQATAAAVLYSTATPASDVRRLGYMTRLRLWGRGTPFEDFGAFAGSLARWGLDAAELLALELKRRGVYCCHRLPDVEVETLTLTPCARTRALFDAGLAKWAAPAVGVGSPCGLLFMRRLLTSLKVRLLAPRWRQDLAAGAALVIVLQGTGAAAQACDDGTMLQRCLRRGGQAWKSDVPLPADALLEVRQALPGEAVGEISGRAVALRGARCGNGAALAAFQRGELRVLVLSAAGAVGVNVTSPMPIRMYLVEMPTVPETLAQQLGRCNRLTTHLPPAYYHVTLGTFIERRLAATLARRSATLGALCCADQHRLQLLRHRPWTTTQLRWVLLELATRALVRRAPPQLPLETPREIPPRMEDAALAALDLPLLLRGEPGASLARLLQSCPSAAAWAAPPRWTPQVHASFPSPLRRAAHTVALCLFRTLGMTAELVAHVLGYALGEDWDVAPAVEAFASTMELGSPGTFLDVAAALPLAQQQAVLRCCELAALRSSVERTRLRTVEEHGRRRMERGDRYAVRVELLAETADDVTLRICLDLRVQLVTTPLLFCLPSGRVAHCSETADGVVELRLPGKHRGIAGRTFADVPAAVQGAGLRSSIPVDALKNYMHSEKQERQRQLAAGAACAGILRLVTADPLSHWEGSLKQVLAFEVAGKRMVGLLMYDSTGGLTT